nr:MAG TPA: zinc-ribbon domain protein [Caudoviricetes sp.]
MAEIKMDHKISGYECPECFEAEKNNAYPLCAGRDKIECEECQLRADWEPDDPYGVEHR